MPSAFFAQLSLSSNYSSSSDGWFSNSDDEISNSAPNTQDLLSSSKNMIFVWYIILTWLSISWDKVGKKRKSFDTEVYNPIVHTISVFKPKIPRFLIYPANTSVHNCKFKCFKVNNDNFKTRTGPRLRIRLFLSKLSVNTGYFWWYLCTYLIWLNENVTTALIVIWSKTLNIKLLPK